MSASGGCRWPSWWRSRCRASGGSSSVARSRLGRRRRQRQSSMPSGRRDSLESGHPFERRARHRAVVRRALARRPCGVRCSAEGRTRCLVARRPVATVRQLCVAQANSARVRLQCGVQPAGSVERSAWRRASARTVELVCMDRVERRVAATADGEAAAEQGDEADEALGGTVARMRGAASCPRRPGWTRAPLRSLSPVFGGRWDAGGCDGLGAAPRWGRDSDRGRVASVPARAMAGPGSRSRRLRWRCCVGVAAVLAFGPISPVAWCHGRLQAVIGHCRLVAAKVPRSGPCSRAAGAAHGRASSRSPSCGRCRPPCVWARPCRSIPTVERPPGHGRPWCIAGGVSFRQRHVRRSLLGSTPWRA